MEIAINDSIDNLESEREKLIENQDNMLHKIDEIQMSNNQLSIEIEELKQTNLDLNESVAKNMREMVFLEGESEKLRDETSELKESIGILKEENQRVCIENKKIIEDLKQQNER